MDNGFVGITRRYESRSKWSDIARNISSGVTDYLSVGDSITDRLKDGREFAVEVAAIAPYEENTVALVFKNVIDNHCMNNDATNDGGWRDSEMRQWLNREFIELLPDELRKVIKPRAIYQRRYDQILESTDNLWLLSEVEIFGSSVYSNSDEDDAHFELFKDARSRVKTDANGNPARWWERSPYYSGSSVFCYVYADGSASNYYANYSRGVAPAFII